MIVVGGAIGTILGIITFSYFNDIGKINIVISLAYMYILAFIGSIRSPFINICFRFSKTSMISSFKPGIVENSWLTLLICTPTIDKPGRSHSKTRLNALPIVTP